MVENCNDRYYVNIQAIGLNGLTSPVASSDGVMILEPGADPDGDGHINENEITAESNACNVDSFPQDSTVHLVKWANFISIPAEVMFRPAPWLAAGFWLRFRD